ncbi:hypothetical protein K461DRAFT_63744 [Myriangium duriaei CBS 260.36]|uniref:Uncharacterized protein n=1 Tax=Myriangium duriaei CBS 260.36 TaxID=1168546 RepID=A0A9P4ITJ4_9PEZI|nr:hypothetical protein K461DRAFT_63744 [Myriangium duriaei CBS 260.36]
MENSEIQSTDVTRGFRASMTRCDGKSLTSSEMCRLASAETFVRERSDHVMLFERFKRIKIGYEESIKKLDFEKDII